ncbi:hypothetical protein [Pseudobacteriovorax antillogorgiicola]|uniref:PilZ domain-containing protein n=1 Tax=Pseudobacteriovorax antillogorgiicola TaxID=1513793 RepID=A0A1Y6C1C3_9BACT|nr:hypothetical protein [Pseudobacteriovorax antillogorgiicola]TCS50693.1 hypothetical protein EDD56_11276 [Pseudobacteriovorax antillogorgiicola]SMF40395.1 hypothetical protein SAMN06296036_11275 [Pseudobacteriovorax antillogorgiicola]
MSNFTRFAKNIGRYLRQKGKFEAAPDTMWSGASKRQFHRHHLRGIDGFYLVLEGSSFPLVNVSNGGTCIESNEKRFAIDYLEKKVYRANLYILGKSTELPMSIHYVQGELIGFAFPDQPELRKLLDEALYYLDAGLFLKTLVKSQVSSFFQSPAWSSYSSFNGVVEVHTSTSLTGELDEVNISYIQGFYREYTVFSHKAITVSSSPERVLLIGDKKQILRNCLLVILGFRQIGKTKVFDQLIVAAIALLRKDLTRSQ